MNEHHDRALSILEELGSRPAAPFFEDGPAGYITEVLARLDIPAQRDTYGNIVAHYSKASDGSQPPVAFVAHMDHPGFEIISRLADGTFTARALGGVPAASLKKPTPALVLTADGGRAPAELVPIADPTPDQAAERLVNARVEREGSIELPAPVVFDLPDFELDGDTIRMRALDDLAGCASILAALERLVADGAEASVYAVFTRAEEVGLIGARLVAEAGALPSDTLVVSVESSAVIPGVEQGKGPVIRTGDASRTFDADAELLLIAARESIRKRSPEFSCQRQLMSGGTCEATAFGAFGYSVTGVAFPLGNYHNATTSIPDPDGGVGAEYISLSDYLGGVDLIAEAATSVANRDRHQPRWASHAIPDDMRRRLRDALPAP